MTVTRGGQAANEARVLDHRQNPFGLMYEDAITANEPGHVNINSVTYTLGEVQIAANAYTPADYDPDGGFPAIAVAHPNGGVKEQVAGRYAQRLALQGFVTIAADAAYQGASEGQPRHMDSPTPGPTTFTAWRTSSPASRASMQDVSDFWASVAVVATR